MKTTLSVVPYSNGQDQLTGRMLDADLLRPSAAILGAQIALSAAIESHAVAPTGHDPTTLDLLTRLSLAEGNQLRAVELCRQLRLSPSHVSRMLDRAEADDLVKRGPDPNDRRAHQVSITASGWAVVAQFWPRLQTLLTEVVYETLDSAEIDSLITILGKIEDATTTFPRNGA